MVTKTGNLAILIGALGFVYLLLQTGEMKGDIDGDGQITLADAEMIGAYITGLVTLTPEQLHRADVNGDGVVDIGDALWIAQYVAGQR